MVQKEEVYSIGEAILVLNPPLYVDNMIYQGGKYDGDRIVYIVYVGWLYVEMQWVEVLTLGTSLQDIIDRCQFWTGIDMSETFQAGHVCDQIVINRLDYYARCLGAPRHLWFLIWGMIGNQFTNVGENHKPLGTCKRGVQARQVVDYILTSVMQEVVIQYGLGNGSHR